MRISYRPDIDGLRAVSVLAVLLYHGFPELFPGGFIGVDVFFVISGYLITSLLAEDLDRSEWSIGAFYARRILRIFPALLLVLTATLLLGWYTLLADEYKQLGKHIAAGAGFASNFVFWFEAGYFDRASDLKPLLHLWSLGIEEQFYIFWPVLLWAAWRLGWRIQTVALALFTTSFVISAVMVFVDRTQAFYSPVFRAWELVAGAVLAITLRRGVIVPPVLRSAGLQACALLVIAVTVFFLSPSAPFPGALALLPVIAAVVLLAAHPDGAGVTALLRSRPLVALGLISYPLYLWHWPLLAFARIIQGDEPQAVVRAALLACSVALAALTYFLLERPVRRLPRNWAIVGLSLGIACIGALGASIYKRDGLERVRHKRIIHVDGSISKDFIDFEKTGLITDAKCNQPFRFPGRDVCLVAHPDRPVTAAVVGDSHALHAYWGLAAAFEQAGLNLKVLGKGACVPLLGFAVSGDPNRCQPHMDDTLKGLAESPAVRDVALVFRGRYFGTSPAMEELQAFEEALHRTLRLLTQGGKKVYYFLPLVEPGFDPRLCAGNLPLGRKPPRTCVIDQTEEMKKTATLRTVIKRVLASHPEVTLVDPNRAWCQDDRCPIIQQGHSIFKDDNHLSEFGSRLVGAALSLSPP